MPRHGAFVGLFAGLVVAAVGCAGEETSVSSTTAYALARTDDGTTTSTTTTSTRPAGSFVGCDGPRPANVPACAWGCISNGKVNTTPPGFCTGEIPGVDLSCGQGLGCMAHDIAARCTGSMISDESINAMTYAAIDTAMCNCSKNGLESIDDCVGSMVAVLFSGCTWAVNTVLDTTQRIMRGVKCFLFGGCKYSTSCGGDTPPPECYYGVNDLESEVWMTCGSSAGLTWEQFCAGYSGEGTVGLANGADCGPPCCGGHVRDNVCVLAL